MTQQCSLKNNSNSCVQSTARYTATSIVFYKIIIMATRFLNQHQVICAIVITILFTVPTTWTAAPKAPRRELVKPLNADCHGPIAFSAVQSTSKSLLSITRNKPIAFDKILTDKLSGFHQDSGIFTTPCPGLYQITFAGYGDDLRLALRKRPSSATNSWMTLVETGKKGGSQTVLLQLEIGEELAIFMETGVPYSNILAQSFAGFKLSS